MENSTRLEADNRFSILPHWVIFSGISAGAIHLYAVLAKYADYESGRAWPARATLAKDLGKSRDSVDRYTKELLAIKALTLTNRYRADSKENMSNVYTIVTAKPPTEEVAAPMPPHGRTNATENDTHLTDTQCFTSEQSSELMLHPHSYERGSEIKKSAGELADPISPSWYHSQDRQIILSNIQAIAAAKAAKDPVTAAHLVETLYDNLCAAFNSDGDIIDGLIWDENWEPKRPQADREPAGKWLNSLLWKWKGYTEIIWRNA